MWLSTEQNAENADKHKFKPTFVYNKARDWKLEDSNKFQEIFFILGLKRMTS